MKSNQFSLRKLLLAVALFGVAVGFAFGGLRWLNGLIQRVERDAMRQSIIEYEIDHPDNPPERLNSEYAHRLLGDEIETLRAQRQQAIDAQKAN